MSGRLNFTPAQIRAAAKVAKEFRVSVRLEPDGTVVVSPSSEPAGENEFDNLQEYLEWRDGRHLETKRPKKEPETVNYYAAAFAKMDPNSRKILTEGYLWEWDDFKAHVLSKPLNKREAAALEALSTSASKNRSALT